MLIFILASKQGFCSLLFIFIYLFFNLYTDESALVKFTENSLKGGEGQPTWLINVTRFASTLYR